MPRTSLRLGLAVAAASALFTPIVAAAPALAAPADDIRINEVQSNSATGAADFIELVNTGTATVDLGDWIVRDDDDTRTLRIPAGTTLAPGAFFVVEPDVAGGFGLGKADEARIFLPDGTTLVDRYAWTEHAFSEGRVPDGTGAFVDTEPTPGAANRIRTPLPEVTPVDSPIVVNEVQSDDAAGAADWVELMNTGADPVDVSGWILKDDDDLRDLSIAPGTTIAPGAFLVVTVEGVAGGFGLGKADRIRLMTADGTGLVDEYAWTEHATTEGRLPDGTGAFVDTEPTPGAANIERAVPSSIVINEIESNGDARGDWIELANTDTTSTVDVSGWTLVDGDPSHEPIVLPAGTTIESGGYRAIITDGTAYESSFGLGGADSITLRDASGQLIAHASWTTHAATTSGRCPDMTGEFQATTEGTFELRNACEVIEEPEVDALPWPYANDVRDAVAAGTWGDDMSGLDFDAAGTLWAVNNDNAEIFELTEAAEGAAGSVAAEGSYAIARSWVPTYPDGAGQPDAEGITIAGDGSVFLATERDNLAKGVSRPSVLRVSVDAVATTTHEWNLTEALGAMGANAGIEGIEWISDADATRLGVVDRTGAAYRPAAFGVHFGGIFAVAVEQTGMVHLVVLEADGSVNVLQDARPGVELAMGLDWQAGGNLLWALCDEACDNRLGQLQFVDGVLTPVSVHRPPTGMNPAFTNEGIALRWCPAGQAGDPTVAWISDAAHDGVSLRVAPGACAAAPVVPAPGGSDPTQPTVPPGAEPTRAAGGPGAASDASPRGALPRTGAEVPLGALAAAAVLLAAGWLLLVARRRAARR